MSYQPRGEVLDWLLAQPEVTRAFTEWTHRYWRHGAHARLTVQLGALALEHGDSGEALDEADPRALSATGDRAHVLREYHARLEADGRALGRACFALTGALLPRAPVSPPCAAAPVAQGLLDRFIAQLDDDMARGLVTD